MSAVNQHIGICALCGEQSHLVDGHIYPRWFYEEYVKSSRDDHMIVVHAAHYTHNKRIRKGFTEKLFCARCDNGALSQIENRARWPFVEMLQRAKNVTLLKDSITLLDPKTGESIQRFAILLAIRSALAKGHFFKHIRLPDERVERLKQELTGTTGRPQILFVYRTDLAHIQAVVEPELIQAYGAKAMFIRLGTWQFFVFLERPRSDEISLLSLGHNSQWPVIWTTNESDLQLIRQLVRNRWLLKQRGSSEI